MKKVIGYLLIIAGFLFLALSVSNANKVISSIVSVPSIPASITNILGVALLVTGVYFTWTSAKSGVKHAAEEVPIYEGEGKKRRIVGYRKMEK